MTWEQLVDAVTDRHPGVVVGKMFGMPCLKRGDGKVIAALRKDGGITVKLVDEDARAEALSRSGIKVASHAFDQGRLMREWVHVPLASAGEWHGLVERALTH